MGDESILPVRSPLSLSLSLSLSRLGMKECGARAGRDWMRGLDEGTEVRGMVRGRNGQDAE